jgi:hypothetical protein
MQMVWSANHNRVNVVTVYQRLNGFLAGNAVVSGQANRAFTAGDRNKFGPWSTTSRFRMRPPHESRPNNSNSSNTHEQIT